ncbi:MAG: hypothetical protein IPJ81_18570 [Chitinophagaceae bacterium]|nr:hypothetical protein [Chitinophagaceae bacterium]
MRKIAFFTFLFYFVCNTYTSAQPGKDTFFLAKKKGLLGKLGRSISTNAPPTIPVKIVNPFLQYKGKIIRYIEFLSLGFERNIYDTTLIKNSFGIRIARQVHKNTTKNVVKNNLFF